jgi:hypothetical protein
MALAISVGVVGQQRRGSGRGGGREGGVVVVVSSEVTGDAAVCFVIYNHQEWYVE